MSSKSEQWEWWEPGNALTGDMMEPPIVFPRVLDDGERQVVEDCLAEKYGLAEPDGKREREQ